MKKIVKLTSAFSMLFVAAAMSMVSCAPDPVPGNSGGGLTPEELSLADSLKNAFYSQARAMQVMLTEEDVHVSSFTCSEAGVYNISLSAGVSFRMLADETEEHAEVLSYVVEGTEMFWAVTDKSGVTSAVMAGGEACAISAQLDVEIKDKTYYLVLGGKETALGYGMDDKVQAFECVPLEDNAGGIYAFRFVFGEDKSKTLYVSGYDGVYFYVQEGDVRTPVSEIYVGADRKAVVGVNIPMDAPVAFGLPEDWSAQLNEQRTAVEVSAPAEFGEDTVLEIASEDGHVFSSVVLTDDMFTSFFASASSVSAAPTFGLGTFAYGISLAESFDDVQTVASAMRLVSGEENPSAGCGVSETSFCKTFAEVLGNEIDPEASYVFYGVADGRIIKVDFGTIKAEMEVVAAHLLDVDVKLTVSGATAIYGGVVEKRDGFKSEILSQINQDACDSLLVEKSYVYEGKATEFTTIAGGGCAMMPETTYVLWMVPSVSGEYTYTEADLYTFEMTTNKIVPGGDLRLTCNGEAEVTVSTISYDLSCENAAMIMYAYIDAIGGQMRADSENSRKFEWITGVNDYRVGDYVSVYSNDVKAVGRGFNDVNATEYWLYAVPVDAEGRYGEVLCLSATTLKLDWDSSITLTVDVPKVTSSTATLKITSEGGDLSDYIYWVGTEMDPFWLSCNSKKTDAEKYMALNPDDEAIQSAMRKYGKISDDGTLELTGLTMDTKYLFLIMEKGDVNYSRVTYKSATTLSVSLGEIVHTDTEKWAQARDKVKITWHTDRFEQGLNGLFSYYSFEIACPTDLTAYIMCASEEYFEEKGLLKTEHMMIEIENCAAKYVEKDHTVMTPSGEMMEEPGYYKGDEFHPGQLMNVVDFYTHGIPTEGTATYFMKGTHGAQQCPSWQSGACSNYQHAQERIAYYRSEEPWKKRAASWGLEGPEADAWVAELTEAYAVYYESAKPVVCENDGAPLKMTNPYATGVNEKGVVIDRVVVMFKDLQGNYYEPMFFEVPNYFKPREEE